TPCCRFFLEPSCAPQRQYEALRAAFIDRGRQKDVAERFGYSYQAFRQLVGQFRARCAGGQPPPLFPPRGRGRRRAPAPRRPPGPGPPATADCGALSLTPGQRLRTRHAGLFLFLPLLARLHFEDLVRQAGYPGSRMVPAHGALLALLALLALKLLDKERRSHI